MVNKRWTVVAGVLLLAGIISSAILLQQRNESRQRWRESRNQITDLDRRNVELIKSLENQKSLLSAEADRRAEKKQAALMAAEIQMTELKSRLGEKQAELDTVRTHLEQANGEMARLQGELVSAEEWAAVKKLAAGLEVRLQELTAERDGLIAQTTILKAEGGDLREYIAEMETRHREALTSRDKKITVISSALEAYGERLEEMGKDKGILVSKLKEANRTITGLRDQIQKVITQVPALKDRLEQNLKKYQAVRENLTEARARQEKLEAQQKAMRETYEALVAGLNQQVDSQEASIEEYREKLKVTFVNRILFGFSQVRISPDGKTALDQLAGALANVPEGRISITGHADSIPVAAEFQYRFPSNWELSSARAAAVARQLLKQGDLEPSQIEVIGLSRYHPVADNDTEAGRAKNRRVEIIITPGLYPDWEN